MNQMVSKSLTFMGKFDSTREYSDGDVVFNGNSTEVVCGGKWIEICGTGTVNSNKETTKATEAKDVRIIPMKCTCCGAPLSYHNGKLLKCFYCGTEYGKETR